MRRDSSFPLLLTCFFLSGLAALVYETAWTREFATVFGTSNLAVATVLAAYMGGLAAGAALAARLAPRLERPVLVYGLLELGIALSALAIPHAIQGSRALYVGLFGGSQTIVGAGGAPTALFYLACSFLILLVPTSMMGATLPLLARHAVRSDAEIGRRVGVLYTVNTAGAVAGTLLAAFVLVPTLGLRLTIWAAAGINALVFLAAWALARSATPVPPAAGGGTARSRTPHPILLLIFLSGAVSFAYEILWSRLLTHVVGGSMYAFATMLASFLMGIALGSAVASRLATSRARAAIGFGLAQLGIAALSLAAYAGVDRIPALTGELLGAGVPIHLTHATAAMLTLFPAALCIGATFPLAVRVLARGIEDASRATASVYAANTLGAIVGSLAAGFLLVPALGFGGTLALCVTINLVLAALASLLLEPRSVVRAGFAAAGLLLPALFPPGIPIRVITTPSLPGPPHEPQIEFYRVGRAATVLVLDQIGYWHLRTNGLPEANIGPPSAWPPRWVTTRWLTALPVLTRPEARSMLVVGLGGGVAVENVPSAIERIEVVELEQEVIEANRALGPRRWRDPLQDPRLRVHANDARNALLLSGERFDAIVSQPSHPWSPGASLLYTQEFFEIARDHLSPDGVMVQWMGLHFVDEELFASILATLTSVFEHVRVYSPPPGAAALFLASDSPLDTEAAAARALAADPEAFAPLGLRLPEHVTAALVLDERGVATLAAGATPIRDDNNPLQVRAGRQERVEGRWQRLFAEHDPFARAVPPHSDPFTLIASVPPWRVEPIADSVTDPQDRTTARGLAAISQRKPTTARRAFEEVLAQDPHDRRARAELLAMDRRKLELGKPAESIVAPPLSPAERAIVAGWAEGPDSARERDAVLAEVGPRAPFAREARWQRAEWRIRSGDPVFAREAVALADEVIANRRENRALLLRARALAAAGDGDAALQMLIVIGVQTKRRAPPRGALALARGIPDRPEIAELRALALEQLQRRPARSGAATP